MHGEATLACVLVNSFNPLSLKLCLVSPFPLPAALFRLMCILEADSHILLIKQPPQAALD